MTSPVCTAGDGPRLCKPVQGFTTYSYELSEDRPLQMKELPSQIERIVLLKRVLYRKDTPLKAVLPIKSPMLEKAHLKEGLTCCGGSLWR